VEITFLSIKVTKLRELLLITGKGDCKFCYIILGGDGDPEKFYIAVHEVGAVKHREFSHYIIRARSLRYRKKSRTEVGLT